MRIILPDGFAIEVTVALTPAMRERGLSGRASLSESEGMLFCFDDGVARHGFNTRGMHFAIDMVGLSPSGQVLQVIPFVPPDLVTTYLVEGPRVLEIRAGAAARHGVFRGAKLR